MDGGDSAGGSAELARLIDKCGECLLSDLRIYHGVDLRDVLVPGSGLTSRMCIAYVRNLPPDSATIAELRGGSEFRGWGVDRYLFAQIVDVIRENTHAFISANSRKAVKAPEPVPRPESSAEKRNKPNLFSLMAKSHLDKNREIKKR